MSFAYYSSGERDEESQEYVTPDKWSPELFRFFASSKTGAEQAEKVTAKKYVSLPKEFDPSYYSQKDVVKGSTEYYEWKCLQFYATKVYDMYSNMLPVFFRRFYYDYEQATLPEYVDKNVDKIDIDSLTNAVYEAEQALVTQYKTYSANRSLSAKFNNSVLSRLRNNAVKCWIMYHAMYEDQSIPVSDLIKLKSVYQQVNHADPEELMRLYRAIKLVQRKLRISVNKNLILMHNKMIYDGVELDGVFSSLMHSVGGFDKADCAFALADIRAELLAFSEYDDSIIDLITLYDNYDHFRHEAYVLQEMANEWNNRDLLERRISFFDNPYKPNTNYLKDTKKHILMCKNIARLIVGKDAVYQKDVNKLIKNMSQAVDNLNTSYEETLI